MADYSGYIKEQVGRRIGIADISEEVFLSFPPIGFSEDWSTFHAIRKRVSSMFDVPITSVHVCGSCQLGVSPVRFTPFEKGKSDLDLAIIDARLFSELLKEARLSLHRDPNLTAEFLGWAVERSDSHFKNLILNQEIFSPYEISRMVPLQFTLNVMATCLRGFFNRNEGAKDLLEDYSEEFPLKDDLFSSLEKVAQFIIRMKLPEGSIWLRKANIFTLIMVLYRHVDLLRGRKPLEVKKALEAFEPDLPEQYSLAAREAVNNKKERTLRDKYVDELLF